MGVRYFLVIVVSAFAITALRLLLRDGDAIDLTADPEQSAIRRGALWFTAPTIVSVLILVALQYGPTLSFRHRFDVVIQMLIAGAGLGDLLAPPFLWAYTYRYRHSSPATLVLLLVANAIALLPIAAVSLFFYGVSQIH
jgi:hypothetical protein